MKIIDILQGSKEWIDLRSTKITATDCAAICGVSEYKTPRMVWLEKMGLGIEKKATEAMERGKNLEPFARSFYNEREGREFAPVVGVSEENPWQMASFDGIDGDEILEIKCPSLTKIQMMTYDRLPTDWIYQVYHQMVVYPKATKATLLLFHPEHTKEFKFYRDETFEVYREILQIEEERFYKTNILEFEEPDPIHLDILQRKDQEWQLLAEDWKQKKMALEKAKFEEEEAKQKIFALTDPSCTTRGFGVSVSNVIKKGPIDYASIPHLKGLDLEKYRKPPVVYWNIRNVKI